MLGAYNVNGAPCELLVEQDALTWWPKRGSATATTGGKNGLPAATSASPLKHLRRLSNASSVILNNISQLSGGGGGDENDDDKTSDTQQQQDRKTSDRTKNKRRIEFGQIVGLRPISRSSGGDKKATGRPRVRRTGDRANQQSDSSESRTTVSDESSQASQREQPRAQQALTEHCVDCEEKPPVSGESFIKFKLYYVKRSEKKASSRLLKLKKISIGLRSKLKNHDTLDRENSNSNSNSSSSAAAAASDTTCTTDGESNATGQAQEAIVGLYEQIEQYLELVRRQRPKRLLVFVNPFGGKGRALHLYKSKVRKVLELAQVECELVVTKYANHARETIEDPQYDLSQLDGIICIGGDGMFAELMNGLLFRCNRDKLLASELSSLNKRLSDSLLCRSDPQIDKNDTRQSPPRDHLQQSNRPANHDTSHSLSSSTASSSDTSHSSMSSTMDGGDGPMAAQHTGEQQQQHQRQQIKFLRSSLGGIGQQFATPSIPIGVIGAGSTDANLFGFIGTNDAVSATLNIVLGNQIQIDVCSIHSIQDDRLLRFVSTFVAYGYFGDVIRESEKYRWLGPSRYDLTAVNSLIKYRHYQGLVRVLRSSRDGTPLDLSRCHLNCRLCGQRQAQTRGNELAGNNSSINNNNNNSVKMAMPGSFSFDETALAKLRACDEPEPATNGQLGIVSSTGGGGGDKELPSAALLDDCDHFEIVEAEGPFVGVNAAVTACRCPQTRKGFSPGNHLANGCADLILVRPCSRVQYINYLIRTGYTKKSAFDLKYVDAYRCRQFEFIARPTADDRRRQVVDGVHEAAEDDADDLPPGDKNGSSWNADGEILREKSLRVKVNNRLLRVFGTGEPQGRAHKQRVNKKG